MTPPDDKATAASLANSKEMVGPAATEPADQVAAAVLAVPGVARLHPGMFGEVATYLPGRRVHGVQIRRDSAQVHIVCDWGADIPATADAVRSAVQLIVGTPVDVTVQDLAERISGA